MEISNPPIGPPKTTALPGEVLGKASYPGNNQFSHFASLLGDFCRFAQLMFTAVSVQCPPPRRDIFSHVVVLLTEAQIECVMD